METTKKEDLFIVKLGARIAELRKERGFTQESFSIKSGMDRAALAKIESGRVNPTIIVLKRISHHLSIELSELFS